MTNRYCFAKQDGCFQSEGYMTELRKRRATIIGAILTMGLSGVIGCVPTPVAPQSSRFASPAPTRTISTSSVATDSPSLEVTLRPIRKIASGEIRTVWWGDDANSLFFEIGTEFNRYDIPEGRLDEHPGVVMPPGAISEALSSVIPANAELIGVSPSGNEAIWLTRHSRATSSATPPVSGEITSPIEADWWIFNSGSLKLLGSGELCSFSYMWAADADKLLALPASIDSCQAYAYEIDISKSTVTPLFPKSTSPGLVSILAISPNGDEILYTLTDGAYVRRLTDGEVLHVETQRRILRATWYSQDELLVAYNQQLGEPPGLAIVNATYWSWTQIAAADPMKFPENQMILNEILSTDMQKLALITAESRHDPDRSLWIVDVSIP